MNRWYFWVLAPVFVVTAIGMSLLVDWPAMKGNPGAYVGMFVFSGTFLLATLGLASPRRFGWALKVVGGVVVLGVVVLMVMNKGDGREAPTLSAGQARFYNVAGGVLLGLGLLFGSVDALGAAHWELTGPHDRHRSQTPVAPLIFYLTAGWLLSRTHTELRSAAIWLLIVVGTLGLQGAIPSLAKAWATRRRRE